MCRPASFIATKGKIWWSKKTDSHEEIINEFKLHQDGALGPNIVRLEIVPPNEHDFDKPLNEWVYKVDQDLIPEWYDAVKYEKSARKALKDWAKAKLILPGDKIAEFKEGWAILCGGTISAVWGGTISAVWGGTISAVWGGTISEVWGGTISEVCGGTISAVRGGTISAVRGGTIICYKTFDPAKLTSSHAAMIDRSVTPIKCYVGNDK